MKSDLPAHEVARLAALDYRFNGQRCLAEDGDFAGPRIILDAERNLCKGCSVKFDFIIRRHHCRYCSDIYCNKCTFSKCLLPKRFKYTEPQRVCSSCRQILEPQQAQLIREVANHTLSRAVDFDSDVRYWNMPFTPSLTDDIRSATYSLHNMFNLYMLKDDVLSTSLLRNAKGLIFLTILKGGFILAPRFGTGLIVCRLSNGRWSAPSAIGTMGIGWGAVIGADLTDYVIVLRDYKAMRALLGGGQATIGGEVKFTVAGVGRTAALQVIVGEGGCATALAYGHSKGFFAGVSLDGSAVITRNEANFNFYGHSVTPYDLLSGAIEPPTAGQCLYSVLDKYVGSEDSVYKMQYDSERVPLVSSHRKQSRYDKKKMANLESTDDAKWSGNRQGLNSGGFL